MSIRVIHTCTYCGRTHVVHPQLDEIPGLAVSAKPPEDWATILIRFQLTPSSPPKIISTHACHDCMNKGFRAMQKPWNKETSCTADIRGVLTGKRAENKEAETEKTPTEHPVQWTSLSKSQQLAILRCELPWPMVASGSTTETMPTNEVAKSTSNQKEKEKTP